MPELPEVETIKNSIWNVAKHQKIQKVEVRHKDIIRNTKPETFMQYITGEHIEKMERRGKYILFRLSGNKTMVVHLRMTGQLVAFEEEVPPLNHCHLVIYFAHGGIYYRDVRRFGGFWIGEDETALSCGVEKLGMEPLAEDFTATALFEKVKSKHIPVKALLLDQGIIGGIGNIYADEICFAAKIHPLKEGCTLTKEECAILVEKTKFILSSAIACRGTTFSDYRDGFGEKGGFQDLLKVYQRGGMPCLDCGATLAKTKCAGRSTVYCPCCQYKDFPFFVIGLTGGIASGKTMAADYLTSLGAEIIDADEIAREIMIPNGTVIRKIAAVFGEEYILEDGTLNRGKMREDIFKDTAKVKMLNAITHPVIRRQVKCRIKNHSSNIILVVAPLLIEAGFYDICDEVWLLYVDEKQQMKRLLKRDGITKETAKNMISHQYSFEKKKKYADVVIENTTGRRVLKQQLKELYLQRKSLIYGKTKNENEEKTI